MKKIGIWQVLIISLTLLTVIAFSGCGGPKIPGKYISEKGEGYVTFYKDGTCYIYNNLYGMGISCAWKQEDKDVVVTCSSMGQSRVYRIKVLEDGVLYDPASGDKFIREDKMGQTKTEGVKSNGGGLGINIPNPLHQDTPSEVLEKWFDAWREDNKQKMLSLTAEGNLKEAILTGKLDSHKLDAIAYSALKLPKEKRQDFGIIILKEGINANKAFITYTLKRISTGERSPTEYYALLIKENGQWKVVRLD